jgi:hypothetical protein
MGATHDPLHDKGCRLLGKFALSAGDDALGEASGWIDTQLAELNMHPEERLRLCAAISQQLTEMLEAARSRAIASLAIRLYFDGSGGQAKQGWGLFIINKPPRAARSVLDIHLFHAA